MTKRQKNIIIGEALSKSKLLCFCSCEGRLRCLQTKFANRKTVGIDPATGRYIQSDPIGFDGGVNTYLYAGGNPVVRVDENGEFSFCERKVNIENMENLSIYGTNTPPPEKMFNEALKGLKDKIIKCVYEKGIRYLYCYIQKKYGDNSVDILVEYIQSIFCLKQIPVTYTISQSVNRNIY